MSPAYEPVCGAQDRADNHPPIEPRDVFRRINRGRLPSAGAPVRRPQKTDHTWSTTAPARADLR
jgi:hypothetical protein